MRRFTLFLTKGYILPKGYKDRKKLKQRLKRLAPKVPDFTCPDIDWVIQKLEKLCETNKAPSKLNLKVLTKKLERLRSQNEALRDSGKYWYDKMCSYVFKD